MWSLFNLDESANWPGLVLVTGFMLLWTLMAWRFNRMGVYVSDQKVRVRNCTYTIPVAGGFLERRCRLGQRQLQEALRNSRR